MLTRPILLASLLALAMPLLAQTSVAAASDHAALEALVEKVSSTLNAHDAKAFGDCFTEDGEFTNPVGTVLQSRRNIEAFHARLFAPTRTPNMPSFAHARLKVLESRFRMVRPDVASIDVRWQQDGALAPDGTPWGSRVGLLSWIAVRNHDTWRIAVWHNTELPKVP